MSHMDVITPAQGRDTRWIGARLLDRLGLVDWRRNLGESVEEFMAAAATDGLLRTIEHHSLPHTLGGLALVVAEIAAPVAGHIGVKAFEAVGPVLAEGAAEVAERGFRKAEASGKCLANRFYNLLNRPGNSSVGDGDCVGGFCPA